MWTLQLPREGFQTEPPMLEDAVLVDKCKNTYAVADGVTRDRTRNGTYPSPSPAEEAAQVVVDSIHRAIEMGLSVPQALTLANRDVRRLNERLGFWSSTDFLSRDLAGAVAAAAMVRGSTVDYALVGDCGLAIVDEKGCLVSETRDRVAEARSSFPADGEVEDRKVAIRSRYRNRPTADHPTYGVLTGEDAAVEYMVCGQWRLGESDTLVLFTDGFRPLLYDAPSLRILTQGEEVARRLAERVMFLRQQDNMRTLADDVSAVLARETPPSGMMIIEPR